MQVYHPATSVRHPTQHVRGGDVLPPVVKHAVQTPEPAEVHHETQIGAGGARTEELRLGTRKRSVACQATYGQTVTSFGKTVRLCRVCNRDQYCTGKSHSDRALPLHDGRGASNRETGSVNKRRADGFGKRATAVPAPRADAATRKAPRVRA